MLFCSMLTMSLVSYADIDIPLDDEDNGIPEDDYGDSNPKKMKGYIPSASYFSEGFLVVRLNNDNELINVIVNDFAKNEIIHIAGFPNNNNIIIKLDSLKEGEYYELIIISPNKCWKGIFNAN